MIVTAPPTTSLVVGVQGRPADRARLRRSLGRDWVVVAVPARGAVDVLCVMGSGRVADDLDRLARASAERPDVPIVLLVPSVRATAVPRLLAAGASGIVHVRDVAVSLEPTLRSVLAGQVCLPHDAFAGRMRLTLSRRERQVLGMVVLGLSNAEMASELFLTESTIKSHLSSAFRKLGVRSRNEARAMLLDREAGLGLGVLALSPEPSADDALVTLGG